MEDERAASGLTLNSLSSRCHLWPPLSAWNLKAGLLINLLASISGASTHRPALAADGSTDNKRQRAPRGDLTGGRRQQRHNRSNVVFFVITDSCC